MQVNFLKREKNEVEFEIVGMDVSIPEMLVAKLNENDSVDFAAYKLEHPLVANPLIYVKTKRKDAADVVLEALEKLKEEINEFRQTFKKAKA